MPKQVDHAARREAVAQAVWTLLEREGVDALTVREVARQADVSTGSLAHYFSSKDDLLSFAMNLAFDRAAQRIARVAQQAPALAALRAVCRETMPIEKAGKTEYHAWLFFWSRAASRADLSSEHAERYALWRATLEFLISTGKTDGSIRPDCNAKDEADLLAAFIDGIGLEAVLEPTRLTPERLGELLDAYLSRLDPAGASTGRPGG
jgi:AcrR family transcriptional regulator